MNWKVAVGIMLIIMGVGLFAYYDRYVRPEREAKEMLAEAKIIFERGDETADRESINQAIGTLSRLIARYPESKAVPEAYYYIARSYERLNLYRLAHLKYSLIVRNKVGKVSPELRENTLVRLAHINVLKRYSEEGIHQLYTLLNNSANGELRGRIYSELGHAYLNMGRYEQAKRMFDISLGEYGGNEEAILGKARAYKRMGHDAAAYNMYDYFLRYYGGVSPYAKDVRRAYREQAYWSGLQEYRRGHYDSALGYFDRVLRNFPSDRKSEYALYWAGESYFAKKDFNRALSLFDRVLSNGYYEKDQDARIKKGYAYFMSKRFDLAAREFQTYLRDYPRGKYSDVANEWKSMSTRELLYRIESQKLPEAEEGEAPAVRPKKVAPAPRDEEFLEEEKTVAPKKQVPRSKKVEEEDNADEEVGGSILREGRMIELDIVTEL